MPCQQSATCSPKDLVRIAMVMALVVAISPAWLLGQESERRGRREFSRERRSAETSTAEKPATEKPGAETSAAATSTEKATDQKSAAEKPAAEKPAGESSQAQPSTDSGAAAAPIEQQLQRNSEGKIRFSFQNQPWLDILQWLAKSSKMTLDWQELPEDKLNLATQSSYSLDEARDLFNMHLAARGFTLLRRGEVLALVKFDKLNPALVPRVDPEELDGRDNHEIVRVSFPLDWLIAEEAVKEFEPMKSPFGKLTPMSATNRLEALDTVENLRQIREILKREQSAHGEERLVVEFKLKHVRAEDIIDKLSTLVGAENNLLRPQDRARMQQFMRMRQRGEEDKNRNNNNRPAQREEQPVHLVINEQENSILANAPPDKLAVIRQSVQALDVPSAASTRLSDAVTRMKIYRTKTIDPDALQELIQDLVESGKLAKNTQVQSDDDSNTLIVYASPVDHLAIANLVSQIDDDGRDVRVITLRELTPEYAMQAIEGLLKGQQSDSGGSSRWGRRRGGDSSNQDQFRMEADVERNRLLLWANEEEYVQIQELLAKLGEDGHSSTARGNIRILSVPAGTSQQALDNLKRIWPNLRNNPLNIRDIDQPPVRESARQPSSRRSAQSLAPSDRTAKGESDDDAKSAPDNRRRSAPPVTFAVAALAGDDEARDVENGDVEEPASSPEPSDAARDRLETQSDRDAPSINITEGPGGQLIITSQDVEALDAVESLIQQIMPKKADYEVFRLQHASPFSIQLTLEQFFGMDQYSSYGSSSGRSGLSASPTPAIKFISDIDTGTLLVQGATDDQLQKIQGLIQLYDKEEELEEDQQRKTEIYEVKYSHAQTVAEVVKEVYRDLLSSTDKAFSRERREGDGSSRDLGYGVNYGSKIPQFKGLLSIGVEEQSNTLVVSAPTFLIKDVLALIRQVDEQAASQKAQVVQLNGVGAETLRGLLSSIPGVTTSGTPGRSSTGVGSSSRSSSSSAVVQGRSSTSSRGDFGDRSRFGGDRSRSNFGRSNFERGNFERGNFERGGSDRGGSSFNRRGGRD